jgi:phosphoserine phosphatase
MKNEQRKKSQNPKSKIQIQAQPTNSTRNPKSKMIWLPFDLIIFDCDSTLSLIEGIDELARLAGQEAEIAALTTRAMEGDIPLEAVYERRMVAVKPTRAQLRAVRQAYRDKRVADAPDVIGALKAMGKEVFIVSGGLREAVADFGEWLGLAPDRIFAVGMEYNQLSGEWWHYNQPNHTESFLAVEDHPLTATGGKAAIITQDIRSHYKGRAMLIGDGLSDLEARPAVDLFVGFGGAVKRARIAAEADVFIHTPYLSPIVALAAGRSATASPVLLDGLRRIAQGEATFRDAEKYLAFQQLQAQRLQQL